MANRDRTKIKKGLLALYMPRVSKNFTLFLLFYQHLVENEDRLRYVQTGIMLVVGKSRKHRQPTSYGSWSELRSKGKR